MWDPVWERVFKERSTWAMYPPEELVRFFARVPNRAAVKVLDLGCGPGAGPSWFVAREGFSLTGIDGSTTAIAKARGRFSADGLDAEFQVGDLAALPYDDERFDCAIDIACVQCNTQLEAMAMVSDIHRVLKPQGRYFSIASAQGTWGDGTGQRVDETTFTDIPDGPFARMGKTRFASKEEVLKLHAPFAEIELNYSLRSLDGEGHEVRNWVIACKK
jgi:SAM-dependent methyltransferase